MEKLMRTDNFIRRNKPVEIIRKLRISIVDQLFNYSNSQTHVNSQISNSHANFVANGCARTENSDECLKIAHCIQG